MSDNEIFCKAVGRAKVCGIPVNDTFKIIVFLENELDSYRENVKQLRKALNDRDNETSTVDAVQQSTTTGEIINALADNGYNTITINCYKDIEREV